jgi:hypothetical protein
MKYLALLLLLSSCSASWHLNRAIKKGAKVRVDTVTQVVEVVVQEVKTDTVFRSEVGDTVYITEEKLKIKYVKLPGERVFIEGECSADTIYQTIKVPCETTITAPPEKIKWWHWLIVVLVLLIVLGIVWRK